MPKSSACCAAVVREKRHLVELFEFCGYIYSSLEHKYNCRLNFRFHTNNTCYPLEVVLIIDIFAPIQQPVGKQKVYIFARLQCFIEKIVIDVQLVTQLGFMN